MKNPITRRRFTQLGTAAWGALAFGCGQDQRELGTREGSGGRGSGGELGSGGQATGGQSTGAGGTGGAPEPPLGGMGGVPTTCGELTLENIQGPFFLAGSLARTDIREDQAGPPLSVSGKVYDTNCQPIAGALVDFWQADEAGAYDQDGPIFRGHQFTEEDGSYSLSTIVPGRYLNGNEFRPAHIHVRITVPGYTFVTQLYFPGDPYNEIDLYFREELVVALATDGDSGLRASFDFYLPPAP